MQIGSLVKIKESVHPHAKDCPKGVGVVLRYRDEGLHKMYNTAYVLWPNTGEERSIRHMFLETICK